MATLILIRNSDGVVGRCDATCYNARRPRCHCICRGRNHGVGYHQAVNNNTEDFGHLLKLELPPDVTVTIHSPDRQLPLPLVV